MTEQQLEFDWEIPTPTPATTDFVCWLWAAFPPRNGRLNISAIARALGTSPTTLRRWIIKDTPKITAPQLGRLSQRAILRGRGHYLWPDLDPATRRRSELQYASALRNDQFITETPELVAPTWRKNGTLDPRVVQLVYFPRAHAFGVSAATHDKARAKVQRHGEIIETRVVTNKFAAIALKHEALLRVDEHRCITPRHLVPTGHTETWREAGGPGGLTRPLTVTVIRFAGLTKFAEVTAAIERIPNVELTEHVVQSAPEACRAFAAPADVVILTSNGYDRAAWGRPSKPWPGGTWYAGGRGARSGGMSLAELLDGVAGNGGGADQTRLFLLDVDALDRPAVRRRLRGLEGTHGRLAAPSHRARSPHDLAAVIDRAAANRDAEPFALLDSTRYRLV